MRLEFAQFDQPLVDKCLLCGQGLQSWPHNSNSKFVRQWEIEVCRDCYAQDGIDLKHHLELIERLNAKGIRVQLNHRGRLDWPPG
jgi:hypothetical protein